MYYRLQFRVNVKSFHLGVVYVKWLNVGRNEEMRGDTENMQAEWETSVKRFNLQYI